VVQLFGTPAVAPASAPMVQKPAASPVVVEKVTEQATSLASELVETLPVSVTAQAEQSFPSTEEVLAVEVTEIPLAEVTEAELPAIISESEVVKEAVLPVPVTENSADVVVIESPLIATSSGLAIAQITTERAEENYLSISAVATQPNTLLQYLYMTIGVITLVLLFSSIVLEARRFHFTQVAYGFLLLIGMGALWYTHLILTNGAVVI